MSPRKPFTARLADTPLGIAIAVIFMFALMGWGFVLIIYTIWKIIRLGIIEGASAVGLDWAIGPYIDLLTFSFLGLLCLWYVKYVQLAKIPRVFLVHQVGIEQLEAERLKEFVFPPSEFWDGFMAKVKPDDQIWLWKAPKYTWRLAVGGREGYVIVRSGKPTRHWICTRPRSVWPWAPY